MTDACEEWSQARSCVGNGRLSVVLPVYNLGSTIAANLREIATLYADKGLRAELIPVDDGSSDNTRAALLDVAQAYADERATVVIRPVLLDRNGGKGAALRAGFEAATGDYVLLLDGDLDINPSQTGRFFAD